MALTRGQLWRSARDRLAAGGIETATIDARVLLQFLLGIDQTHLIASEADPVTEDEIADFEGLVARRLGHEPVARIVGHQEFYGLDFRLGDQTLVPRPETEMLVDFGIGLLETRGTVSILDLGTGTGCIAIALLANLPKGRATGVDAFPGAVRQARANADALGVGERFEALEGSWYGPVAERRYHLVVSNPPYIARNVIPFLAPEVAHFDPVAALDGGEDGLVAYRAIIAGARDHLFADGAIALEIGFDQGDAVRKLLVEQGFCRVGVEKDLSGHDRVVTGHLQ